MSNAEEIKLVMTDDEAALAALVAQADRVSVAELARRLVAQEAMRVAPRRASAQTMSTGEPSVVP